MNRQIALALSLAALLSAGKAQAIEGTQTFHTSYSVSLLGFRIGVTDVATTLDGDNYRLEGRLRSTGLARLLGKVEGSTTVRGTFTTDGPQPQDFAMSYVNGGQRTASQMAFQKGEVVSYEVSPKPKSQNPRYVVLSPSHLFAVSDPFTSLMVKARSLEDVCGRTIKAFDGELRADFALSRPKVSKVSVPGYSGPAVTCQARFVPVAGYTAGSSTIEFLRKRARMTITFAPQDVLGIYAPVGATIQSTIGWVTVRATRFAVQQ